MDLPSTYIERLLCATAILQQVTVCYFLQGGLFRSVRLMVTIVDDGILEASEEFLVILQASTGSEDLVHCLEFQRFRAFNLHTRRRCIRCVRVHNACMCMYLCSPQKG